MSRSEKFRSRGADAGPQSFHATLVVAELAGIADGRAVWIESTSIEARDAIWVPAGALVSLVEGGLAVEVLEGNVVVGLARR